MALNAPSLSDRKRVKVYELKSNDWHDRGTGFCAGSIVATDDARIVVQSEEDDTRTLLETRIGKDDGYQKQQDTLIVWTEPTGIDMALSFQEPDGCTAIWDFVYEIQQRLIAMAPDDLDEDMLDANGAVMLPIPELGNLRDVENAMKAHSASGPGRDALIKFIAQPDNCYIHRLIPLVEMAEDLEDLEGLHRLCSIMKTLILLNDTSIIELIVKDDTILGVVGALEYDPDFPSHKANHRQFLANNSKFKEVVKIDNPEIRQKIHFTYRLHYLKDVVLARILDDPTFSILNSIIFFNQVEVVNYVQQNGVIMRELFEIIGSDSYDRQRRKDAVLFIQHLCALAKHAQAPSRAMMYGEWINSGLFEVITYALTNSDAAVRVAGSDILVALIDHDASMMRGFIVRAINEKSRPLTDTLVELLLVEQDLGIKTQIADAIKILLDPTSSSTSMDMLGKTNGEFLAKVRSNPHAAPQTESFIQAFYDESARKLFQPLKHLATRKDLSTISASEALLYEHLISILCFFTRLHAARGKEFAFSEGLYRCVGQLMSCPQKHLKLAAVRWLRTWISLGDGPQIQTVIDGRLLGPLLDLLQHSHRRDNLLNSACLELFEHVRSAGLTSLIVHLVETYREQMNAINYVETFEALINKYDQRQAGPYMEAESSFSTQGAATPNRNLINGGQRWNAGIKETDADEEAYFATSDDEENELIDVFEEHDRDRDLPNGASPARPLVAYPDDDDDDSDSLGLLASSPEAVIVRPNLVRLGSGAQQDASSAVDSGLPSSVASTTSPQLRVLRKSPAHTQLSTSPVPASPDPLHPSPPSERPSEKRRREEDDDDALALVAANASKRRNSTGPISKQPQQQTIKLARSVVGQQQQQQSYSHSPSPSPSPSPNGHDTRSSSGGGGGGGGTGAAYKTTARTAHHGGLGSPGSPSPAGKDSVGGGAGSGSPALRRKGSLRQQQGGGSGNAGREAPLRSAGPMHISVKSGVGDKDASGS